MDKAEYLRRLLEIEERVAQMPDPRLPPKFLPGGGKKGLVMEAENTRAALKELDAIPRPEVDAAGIERHFIAPLAERAAWMDAKAAAASRWMTLAKARRIVARAPDMTDEDVAWCDAYGMTPSNPPVTFAERAAAVGLDANGRPVTRSPLTDADTRQIQRGGVTIRGLFWVLSPIVPVAIGYPLYVLIWGHDFVVSVVAIAIASSVLVILVSAGLVDRGVRAGRTIRAAMERDPSILPAVGVVYRIGNVWHVAVATERDPTAPVAAAIAGYAPKPIRDAPSWCRVVGDVSPGGRFAVVLDNGGGALVAYKDAYPCAWPPPLMKPSKPDQIDR